VPITPYSLLGKGHGKDNQDISAFSKEQVEFFSEYFAKALTRATPFEEIVFFWQEERDHHIHEITSGHGYIQGRELHLLFANYRQAISRLRQAEKVRTRPQHMLGDHFYRLHTPNRDQEPTTSLFEMFLQPSPQLIVLPLQNTERPTPLTHPFSNLEKPSTVEGNPTIQHKLRTLKSLHQKDLITEKEYQYKKRQILERF